MSKVVVDTSLYIDFLRTGNFFEAISALYTFRVREVYFSSVVIEELLQGVQDRQGKEQVEILYRPFEKVGRIITPSHNDWKRSGEVLSEIRKKRKGQSGRIPGLLNDTLIAMSSLRIGAVVYCANKKDFELIAQIRPFQFQVL